MSDVRVQFATTFDAYRVTETPFAVPSKLNAAGLSDVICHLLELEPAIPFDFLVDGQLVRTSLRKHLAQHGLSEVRNMCMCACCAGYVVKACVCDPCDAPCRKLW